jgi:Sec-independent protein secretion pathway component TatC
LLAVPLCALYGISIGIAWIFGKKPDVLAETNSPNDTNANPG